MSEAADIFPGGAFEGEDDSASIVGQISVSSLSLTFEAEGLLLDLPTQGLRMDWDAAGERILFSHEKYPAWRIYSLDDSIFAHRAFLQPWLKRRLEELRPPEAEAHHAKRVYKTFGAIALVLAGLWAFTDPIIGVIVKMLPAAWEQKVGKEAFMEMRAFFDLNEDPAMTNRVHLVAQRLKKGLPMDAPKFRFHVASFPLANAVALPGGDVIVMDALLVEATPDELAGVLAHEMAHVIEKHAMRHIAQEAGPEFIIKYVFGGDSALSELMAGASTLGNLQYSRANERAADQLGFSILEKANVDPRSLAGYFKKVRKIEGKAAMQKSVFSTHPPTDERIKDLEKLWATSAKKSGYAPVDAGPDLPEPKPSVKFLFR